MRSRIHRWAVALVLGIGLSLVQSWAGSNLPRMASATICAR